MYNNQLGYPEYQQGLGSLQPGYPEYQQGLGSFSPNLRQLRRIVDPLVNYGIWEARRTGIAHAMREVAIIAYLMGAGYEMQTAHRIAESFEVNEFFPG